jgi:hypothetical protein
MEHESIKDWVTEIVMEENDEALFFDGFDDAIIGVGGQANGTVVVIYDEQKIIANLMAGGLDYEDALDHYFFNIKGAYLGESTPIILRHPYYPENS